MKFKFHALALAFLCFHWWSCQSDASKNATESVLRIRLEADANGLNPLFANGYGRYVAQQIIQPLGQLDPNTLELKPLLLKNLPESVSVADGEYRGMLAYDFELLDEAVWDNGTPVTAHDVVFSIKAILNPHAATGAWKPYFEQVKNVVVDAQNPKKFTVYFKQYYILGLETICQFPIFPKYHYDAQNLTDSTPLTDLLDPQKREAAATTDPNLKKFATAFAAPQFSSDSAGVTGSGGYRLQSIQPGEGIILLKKQNYWGNKVAAHHPLAAAHPDKLVYRVVKDESTVESMLRNGEIDVTIAMSTDKFLMLKTDPDLAARYRFDTKPQTIYNQMTLNNLDPRLSDKKVRQALAHCVDYDYLIQEVSNNLAVRTVGPISPMKSYYAKDLTMFDFNVQKAQALLDSAGWKDANGDGILDKKVGKQTLSLQFKLLAPTTSVATKKMAESMVASAKKAGIGIEIVATDINALTAATREGKFEMALLASATFPGADDLMPYLHSKSIAPAGDNRSRFAHSEADKLLESIRLEPNLEKRTEMYLQLQAILKEEVPHIYLTCPMQRYITSQKFDAVISSNRPGYYENLFQLKK